MPALRTARPSRHRTAEQELVLLAARPHADAPARDLANDLAARVDWDALVRTATAQSVASRLGPALAALDVDVPAAARSQLVGTRLLAERTNRAAAAGLADVLEVLSRAGLEPLPFKGPDLAIRCYGSLSARRFGDVDVLVRREHFAAAREELERSGLVPTRERPRTTTVTLLEPERSLLVDLGCMVSGLRADFCWEGAAAVELDGRTFAAIAPEALLVALSVHGSKHFWEALQWICDVAATISAFPALDWAAVTELTARLDVQRVLAVALLLVADLLAVSLPADVFAAARADPAARRVAGRVGASVFAPVTGTRAHWSRTRYAMGLADSLPEKAAVLRHRARRLVQSHPDHQGHGHHDHDHDHEEPS